jgi:hypothetical protein
VAAQGGEPGLTAAGGQGDLMPVDHPPVVDVEDEGVARHVEQGGDPLAPDRHSNALGSHHW